MELGRTVSLSSYVEAEIESSFQAVADYTTFTGCTRLGEEGGWFGFRNKPDKTCYGIFFTGTIGRGVLLLRRDTDGSWHAIKLWGGYCIAVFSRLLAVLKGWWEHGCEHDTDKVYETSHTDPYLGSMLCRSEFPTERSSRFSGVWNVLDASHRTDANCYKRSKCICTESRRNTSGRWVETDIFAHCYSVTPAKGVA